MNHRATLLIMLAPAPLLAACAQRAPEPVASVAAAEPAPATAPTATQAPVTVEDAQRLGYRLVNRDGEPLYCRTQPKTGSRIARETICLTASELQKLGEETRRQISDMSRRTTPPPSR